jgi:hypothetical protein
MGVVIVEATEVVIVEATEDTVAAVAEDTAGVAVAASVAADTVVEAVDIDSSQSQ